MTLKYGILNLRYLHILHKAARPVRRSKWIIPSVLVITATTGITFYSRNKTTATTHHTNLQQEYFTPYKISRKVTNDLNHFIIELTPLHPQVDNIWSTLTDRNLWSIEIKQPEIMVVRNYTPLPVQFLDQRNDELAVFDPKNEDNQTDGRLVLFIKKYDQGEVSRWLAGLPLNHTIEIRGPFIEYNINSTVTNINFFAAGTGIVSPLQHLLNPYSYGTNKPKANLFYSCGNLDTELGLLKRLLFSSLKEIHTFEDYKNQNISQHTKAFLHMLPKPSKSSLSLVCGPDSYIETLAGERYDLAQGPIKGLLGKKGWSNENVYKLS